MTTIGTNLASQAPTAPPDEHARARRHPISRWYLCPAAGWLAGASGAQLQAYTQNAWAIGIVAAILVLLALSMFGFYQIQMPSFIQSKLQMKSQNVKGGSMTGTFFLGMVSALIVGACASGCTLTFG